MNGRGERKKKFLEIAKFVDSIAKIDSKTSPNEY